MKKVFLFGAICFFACSESELDVGSVTDFPEENVFLESSAALIPESSSDFY